MSATQAGAVKSGGMKRGTSAPVAVPAPLPVAFGRAICGGPETAAEREWLVTNGLGGFASGTVAGLPTRRYHGLLMAALRPPLGRNLLVSKIDETAGYDGYRYPLFSNRWADGTIEPRGFERIEWFELEGSVPVWRFACGDALLEKRIWMAQDENTTFVRYRHLRGGGPIDLEMKVLVNYRDFHGTTRAGDWRMRIDPVPRGLRVVAFEGAIPFEILADGAEGVPAHDWFRGYALSAETARGLDDREDHLHAGTFRGALRPGGTITLVLSATEGGSRDGEAADVARRARDRDLLARWSAAAPCGAGEAPAWVRRLVLAADQFVVRRPLRDDPGALSVIAGYHWFGDWGRDTMIALPGLALATGRPEVARSVLSTMARFVDRGMLPNILPDAGENPEFNTVDAALWYVQAVRQYWSATGDADLVRACYPALEEIVAWHERGTRYGIAVDPEDGLLRAGEPGVQLTWMDARIGDWVVTPRTGKPVEVNALWYNALTAMALLARALGRPGDRYHEHAERVRRSFPRFWNESAGFCFDVIDGPGGADPSLRPNQIFAVSLPDSPLPAERQRAVVGACARSLLTSHGLRSLAPDHPDYRGRYGGGPRERDSIYHQGTAWGWLLGPFALAHWRAHGDADRALSFLDPMADHLTAHGLGTAAEIFDGDPPHAPRGCIAQAWTVAELLRAWHVIRSNGREEGRRAP